MTSLRIADQQNQNFGSTKTTDEIEQGLTELIKGEKDYFDLAAVLATWLGISLPEIDVADFRKSGYLPDVLLNYIALLGWSPGKDIERFDMDFVVENFSIERIGKANAKFDRDKLFRFNGDTIAQL